MLRRFPKRVCIPLPGAETRQELLQKCIGSHSSSLVPSQMRRLVIQTEGYSSSDLTHLAKEAAQVSVRRLGSAILHVQREDVRVSVRPHDLLLLLVVDVCSC